MRYHPSDFADIRTTIPQGAKITAHGDLADGSDWIYVCYADAYGFIHLSDFPGIDYLMTEYHYYDKGYEFRFGSPKTKILSYASVLNDVMMTNFNLKVSPYVKLYISAADNCKNLRYGKVTKDNLASSCPKTDGHNSNSCLTRKSIRTRFIDDVGSGNSVVGRCVWTGHILDGHEGSAAQFPSEIIVFSTANTVNKTSSGTYSNKTDYYIRYYSLYEIVHETGHLLGLYDGYCFKDKGDAHCSNEKCYSCNDESIPTCIMAKRLSPESSNVLFCNECISIVESHLSDHH